MPVPAPRAFEVFYGNSLSVLCRDEGSADKHVRDLHGTALQALYPLTPAQLAYLANMPTEPAPCAASPSSSPA